MWLLILQLMAIICRDCSTGGEATPCDGAVVKIYDISVRQEFEVIPIIKPSSDLSTYYYQFSYTSYEGTFFFTIYSRDNGVNWVFMKDDTQVAGSLANVPAGSTCPPESGWTSTDALKMFVTGIENRLIPTESLDPITACYVSVDVPSTANKLDYTEVLSNFKSCFNTKVTTYYNKITGGVPCDNMDLVKLQLILDLLNKKDCDSRALNCIYNRTPAAGVSFSSLASIPSVTSVFANPDKITAAGNFLNYLGYQILVTRTSGEEITHTILDASYNAGTGLTTFTIYPQATGAAYASEVAEFVTPVYSSTTYLETFLNFANKYCSDCIVTPDSVAATGSGTKGKAPTTSNLDPTADYLTKEGSLTTNNLIYLESEFPINLI
jgi:hypothetical protein